MSVELTICLAVAARGAPELTAVEHCQYLVNVDVQCLGCLFNGAVLMVAASHIALPVGLELKWALKRVDAGLQVQDLGIR